LQEIYTTQFKALLDRIQELEFEAEERDECPK
jgi:hypothetical protein